MNKEINLSTKQKEVIKKLRDGYIFLTNDHEAILTKGRENEKISLRVFFNLSIKNLIFQNHMNHFSYELTELGKTIEL